MDPVTHSALGMACGLLVSPSRHRRAGALAGLAAGLLPDADIFLRSASDPLFSLEYHRHFTHSFAFSPVLMVIAVGIAGGLRRLFRRPANWSALWLPALIGVWSHIFCDLWTSYGTRAWWPFSQERSALDWVSVIDPLLTLPLLVLTIVAVAKKSVRPAAWGLGWVSLYLALAIVQGARAGAALKGLMAERGYTAERQTVKPSFGNILLWRGMYQHQGRYYSTAIRCGLGSAEIREGSSVVAISLPEADQAWGDFPARSVQLNDVARFAHFSDGWVAWHPTEPNVIGDLRYAQMPHEIAPLWGIRLDAAQPEKHVEFVTFRNTSAAAWKELWEMICGKGSLTSPVPPPKLRVQ